MALMSSIETLAKIRDLEEHARKILSEANEKAKKIEEEANLKAQKTLEEAKKNAEEQAETIQQDAQKQIDEAVNTIVNENNAQISALKENANQNFSKVVDQIIEALLRVIS
jgi:vacuolar-type H+-ATPase subunit H